METKRNCIFAKQKLKSLNKVNNKKILEIGYSDFKKVVANNNYFGQVPDSCVLPNNSKNKQ